MPYCGLDVYAYGCNESKLTLLKIVKRSFDAA